MWFSLYELKKFYQSQRLDPNSPKLGIILRALRKKVNNQPAAISYLLNNIEVHAMSLLTTYQLSFLLANADALFPISGKNIAGILNHITNRLEAVDHNQQMEYIKQNLQLAIPLCRETLLNKKEFYAILERKSEDLNSSPEFGHSFSLIEEHEKLSAIEEKQQKQYNKFNKFLILQLATAYLIIHVILEERLADSWFQMLPFCFYVQKFLKTTNNYYLTRTVGSWKILLHYLEELRSDKDISSAIALVSSALESIQIKTVHTNDKVKTEILNLAVFFSQQTEILEFIKFKLTRSCMIAAPLRGFLDSISIYNKTPDVNKSVIEAIERDIFKLLREITETCEEHQLRVPCIDNYLSVLRTFFKFTPIEKLYLHQHYLLRFQVQGNETFYQLMIAVVKEPLGSGKYTLNGVVEDYLSRAKKKHA